MKDFERNVVLIGSKVNTPDVWMSNLFREATEPLKLEDAMRVSSLRKTVEEVTGKRVEGEAAIVRWKRYI